MGARSLIFLLLPAAVALAAPEALTDEFLKTDFPGFPHKAVVSVHVEAGATGSTAMDRTYVSGFFVDFTHVLVSDAPFVDYVPVCAKDKPTYLVSGLTKFEPNHDFTNVPRSHKCKRVVHHNSARGYALLEVEQIQTGVDIEVLPLVWKGKNGDLEISEKEISESQPSLFGFALEKNGLQLTVTRQCRFSHFDTPFDPADLTDELKPQRWLWSGVACPLLGGMQGGPLVIQRGRKWYGVGIGVATVGKDTLLTPKLWRVAGDFENELKLKR